MAKVKLVRFEIASIINDSRDIIEYLQKRGYAHLENYTDESLIKYDTSDIILGLEKRKICVDHAVSLLEKSCEIKRGLVESFTDYKVIDYNEYKVFSEKSEETFNICNEILALDEYNVILKNKLSECRATVDYLNLWKELDIVMASKRTMSTRIFIGSFNRNTTAEKICEELSALNEELKDCVAVEIISSSKMYTCAVIICHNSQASELEGALTNIDFVPINKTEAALPSKAIEIKNKEADEIIKNISDTEAKISGYKANYDDLRFLSDYLSAQINKYKAVEFAATTESVFVISGYIPEKEAEMLKFTLENNFTSYVEFSSPDYDNPDVPVLLENNNFASGVENITEMYSSPSNKDVDPNPVMSFFYYAFFGLMLSDAGYGILMVLFSILADKKINHQSSMKKTINMVYYSGISSIIFGALFGGWFGDLIPVICTHFLKMETAPNLALWLDPVSNSIELLLYCLGFGILHLFAGVLLNGYKLLKNKNYTGAIFDTIPTMIFVCGFAVFGSSFLTEIPENIKSIGNKLLLIGAVMIVLTAGRSAKNILGKFGAGLYALYNTASGYLGDILSYSRLLALGLVTGVIASSINLMATMPGNIILFVLIFIVGHTINIAINLIGTYVHTNRLQYVEFFSKFYEGEGVAFTPFRINTKHFIIKEDK